MMITDAYQMKLSGTLVATYWRLELPVYENRYGENLFL